jgi:hypothetical protein
MRSDLAQQQRMVPASTRIVEIYASDALRVGLTLSALIQAGMVPPKAIESIDRVAKQLIAASKVHV